MGVLTRGSCKGCNQTHGLYFQDEYCDEDCYKKSLKRIEEFNDSFTGKLVYHIQRLFLGLFGVIDEN